MRQSQEVYQVWQSKFQHPYKAFIFGRILEHHHKHKGMKVDTPKQIFGSLIQFELPIRVLEPSPERWDRHLCGERLEPLHGQWLE